MSSELKEVINSPILLKLVAQHAFQTMDVNKNGFIDFEEFEDMIKDMANQLNVFLLFVSFFRFLHPIVMK